MDFFQNLLVGFSVSLTLLNIGYCLVGVLVGTLVGVLPGLGPTATIALLMPLTFKQDSISAIIMLAGIYYGAQYGGSTTSILVNIPGEASSVVTALDGYQMARQGKAGPALGIAAFGSFIAGTLATFGLGLLAPPMAGLALKFGPPEYFSLVCLGLVAATFLTQGSMVKSLIMIVFGLLLGTVGRDLITGFPRFTFGIYDLEDGIGFIPIIMGVFGVAEILSNLETSLQGRKDIYGKRITGLLPSLKDWASSIGAILRGSVVGFFLGTLPGGGAVLGSFASYAMEKKLSRTPQDFGKGAIQGVAGPEAANNAASQGAFIPLLTLGIPANAVMALLVGALMIHGVQPGPQMISKTPDLFWGVITSMYLGNILLLILNLPLIGVWIQLLKVPYRILFPLILLFCLIGVYSLNNSIFEIYLMGGFGILGYILKKLDFEPAPLILAVVLGPMMEDTLKHTLLISGGDLTVFFSRPISAAFLSVVALLVVFQLIPTIRRSKSEVLKE
jgi:putative tricarboxylic transport membrane protein